MHTAVEGSQGCLVATEGQARERSIDDLPVELEGSLGRYAGQQVEQGGDGAAGGEYGDVLTALGACQQALQTAADGIDKSLPGLVARLVILCLLYTSDAADE